MLCMCGDDSGKHILSKRESSYFCPIFRLIVSETGILIWNLLILKSSKNELNAICLKVAYFSVFLIYFNNYPNVTWLRECDFPVMTWYTLKNVNFYHFVDKLNGLLFPNYAQSCPISDHFLILSKGFLPSLLCWNSTLHKCCDHLRLDAVTSS